MFEIWFSKRSGFQNPTPLIWLKLEPVEIAAKICNNSIHRCQAGEEEPLTSCLQQTLAYSGFDLYSLGSFLASGSLTSVLEQRFKEKEVPLPSQIRCQDLSEMIKDHFGNTSWAKLEHRRVRCGKIKITLLWVSKYRASLVFKPWLEYWTKSSLVLMPWL